MTYCLQSACSHPYNPENVKYCLSCGSNLLLLNRYCALKPLAQGGFGRTLLAVDKSDPSAPLCVIKQFFPQAQNQEHQQKATELPYQEALRLTKLGKHPQIPELLAYCEQDGQQYLVQEFIDGQNLEQELAEVGAFHETQIWQLLRELLPVLQFVHDQQVIHRDIKPANIIRRTQDQEGVWSKPLGGNELKESFASHSSTLFFPTADHHTPGQLVLVDFGAAKSASSITLVKTGTVIGSAEYTAPEQIRGKAVFASDLYSLGVTCIHLLTQMSPFDLFDSSEDAWVWRDYLNCPVSESLARILDKLLQNAIRRRYQSAAEVLKDLNTGPTQATLTSLPTMEATDEEDFESPYFGISFPKVPWHPVSARHTKSSLPATPVISATVFNPQTQAWYHIRNIFERSESVWSVAPFMRPQRAVASLTPIRTLTFHVVSTTAPAKPKQRAVWVLTALWVAIFTCLTIGLRLKQPSTSPEVLPLSDGIHHYLNQIQKEEK